MVEKELMESNSNRYAAKNVNESDNCEGELISMVGRGRVGYFLAKLWRCLTPVLYVFLVDGARASL